MVPPLIVFRYCILHVQYFKTLIFFQISQNIKYFDISYDHLKDIDDKVMNFIYRIWGMSAWRRPTINFWNIIESIPLYGSEISVTGKRLQTSKIIFIDRWVSGVMYLSMTKTDNNRSILDGRSQNPDVQCERQPVSQKQKYVCEIWKKTRRR